uniref:Pco133868b n=1 Tax=Arundo donax TaxID=35708 RepID=A0A0A9EDT0_ARUDO
MKSQFFFPVLHQMSSLYSLFCSRYMVVYFLGHIASLMFICSECFFRNQ